MEKVWQVVLTLDESEDSTRRLRSLCFTVPALDPDQAIQRAWDLYPEAVTIEVSR
jgi:hypothetical protein